jgi:hypothetical protein
MGIFYSVGKLLLHFNALHFILFILTHQMQISLNSHQRHQHKLVWLLEQIVNYFAL